MFAIDNKIPNKYTAFKTTRHSPSSLVGVMHTEVAEDYLWLEVEFEDPFVVLITIILVNRDELDTASC